MSGFIFIKRFQGLPNLESKKFLAEREAAGYVGQIYVRLLFFISDVLFSIRFQVSHLQSVLNPQYMLDSDTMATVLDDLTRERPRTAYLSEQWFRYLLENEAQFEEDGTSVEEQVERSRSQPSYDVWILGLFQLVSHQLADSHLK